VLCIDGKLAGDTTLTNLLGTPTETMADPSALEDDIWLVKGIDRSTTADTAEAIAARVKTLLNDATLTISGATHLYLRRLSDVEYLETAEGVRYVHSGALFRLVYQ
jgi:DNA-binding LytR/AlgR family response regulator